MDTANFKLRLSGDTADDHHFQAYDGYTSLAGFALTLSLVTNFVETGKVRHKGDFIGRRSVRGGSVHQGSVIADFSVLLTSVPADVFGPAVAGGAGYLLKGLVSRVLNKNLGQDIPETNEAVKSLVSKKRGDVEAITAAVESSVRQSHDVIGNGAEEVEVFAGTNIINTFDRETKRYVKANIKEDEVLTKNVSVSGYYANSRHGSVFDPELGRNVPFTMPTSASVRSGLALSWGLDQYANKTGKLVSITCNRVVAMDGRVKRYIILSAKPARPA